jgi:hypothetical protein
MNCKIANKKLLRSKFYVKPKVSLAQIAHKMFAQAGISLAESDGSIEFLSKTSSDLNEGVKAKSQKMGLTNLDLKAVTKLLKSLQKSSTTINATSSELSFNLQTSNCATPMPQNVVISEENL